MLSSTLPTGASAIMHKSPIRRLQAGISILEKPFSRLSLLQKVRETLTRKA
jgi:hypothetical protein